MQCDFMCWHLTHPYISIRFQGCIGDVRYSNYKGKLIEAELKQTNGERGCTSSCTTPKVNQCQNKGKCVDEIGHVVCDCVATGYEGPLCSISMWSYYAIVSIELVNVASVSIIVTR